MAVINTLMKHIEFSYRAMVPTRESQQIVIDAYLGDVFGRPVNA